MTQTGHLKKKNDIKISVISFAYSMGLPPVAEDACKGGFVFDCRELPDPYFEEGLSGYSGLDQPVIDFFDHHRERWIAFSMRRNCAFGSPWRSATNPERAICRSLLDVMEDTIGLCILPNVSPNAWRV